MTLEGPAIRFEDDFRVARRDDGVTIRFTRAERALLSALASRPHRLMTRQELLDRTAGIGSDSLDRNIDFLVNRVRRKLGDSPRAPIYIATRYGEGYVWVASPTDPSPATRDAVLVIGPVRGARLGSEDLGRLQAFGRALAIDIERLMGRRGQAAFDPDCPPPAAFRRRRPRFGLSLDGFLFEGAVHCALSLHHFDTSHPIWVRRLALEDATTLVGDLAGAALDRLVRSESADQVGTPDAEPLPVRMDRAAGLLTETRDHVEVESHLRRVVAAAPDDAVARLMLATSLHSRMFMGLEEFFVDNCEPPGPLLDEIEELVVPALAQLGDNPIHQLAAAKLLYFVDRGHDLMALDMAESALRESTAFAAAFVTMGQMRCFEGDIDAGWALLDEGLALAAPGSRFVAYIGVVKLQAAIAAGDPDRVAPVAETLAAISPALPARLEIHYAPLLPEQPGVRLQQQIARYDRRRAAALMRYMHAATGRLFKKPQHRSNYLGITYRQLAGHLGPDFVPPDIAADLGAWAEGAAPTT